MMARKGKRTRLRGYLEETVKLVEVQQEKLVETNDKVVELKLERTLLIDAYNYLLTTAKAKVAELLSKDESLIYFEEIGFEAIDIESDDSMLIELMQTYVAEFEDEEGEEEVAEVN